MEAWMFVLAVFVGDVGYDVCVGFAVKRAWRHACLFLFQSTAC